MRQHITNEQLKRGEDLYRDILLIAEGYNPRPQLSFEAARNVIVRECLKWMEQFRELLYPNNRPFKVLLVKNLLRRLLKDDYQRWNVIDDIRASMHTLVDQDKEHTFVGSLWREDYTEDDYTLMLQIVKDSVNKEYQRRLGSEE